MPDDARLPSNLEQLLDNVSRIASEWEQPLHLPKPSGRWIGARDARALLYHATQMKSASREAERALARRSATIPVKVASWSYAWEPGEGLDRLQLAVDPVDMSDWSAEPSRVGFARRISVLERIGDWIDWTDNERGLTSECWESGDFTIVLDGDFRIETISLIGLAFDEVALRASFNLPPAESNGLPGGRSDESAGTSGTGRNAGGRPAGRHGHVIAAVTLRLADLPSSELRRYTSVALSVELEAAYRGAGENPPNERNREAYASGILAVLRARET